MKSFSREKAVEWTEFDVDGEVFQVVNIAPAMAVLDVAKVNDAKDLDKITIIMSFLDAVMESDSALRFAARLSSIENPITIDQASSIAVWLMEEVYATGRPTQEPSQSSNGSGATGTSSTATADSTGSTPGTTTLKAL